MSPWRRGDRVTEAKLTRARENRVAEARLRNGMKAQYPRASAIPAPPWKDTEAGRQDVSDDHEEDRTT